MKISIITVNLNNAYGLEITIKSVRCQTNTNYEFIIIDGKSDDDSMVIIENNKDIIYYFVSESDKGIFDAMNKGLDIATGDFVIFLNSGDSFYDKNIIDYVINNITSLDKIYFGCAKIYHDDNTFYLFPKLDSNKENITKFLKYYLPCHQAIFFPKIFYTKNRYNLQFKNASDEDFKIKAILEYKYDFFNIIISFFVLGGNSSAINSLKKVKEYSKEYKYIHKKYNKYLVHQHIRFFISFFLKYFMYKVLGVRFFKLLTTYRRIC
jgi:putative colanic acid biosynthesis glycosyltransferase